MTPRTHQGALMLARSRAGNIAPRTHRTKSGGIEKPRTVKTRAHDKKSWLAEIFRRFM